MHTQLIPLSGGRNVCRMKETSNMGLERITMEQLLTYDPDVILVKEKACYERIAKDARWKNLRGVQWLSNLLHPDRYTLDIVKETRGILPFVFQQKTIGPRGAGNTSPVRKGPARIFHPDLFRDWDMEKEMRAFYSEVYGKTITERDAERILRNRPPL